jgi:arylsulfatase A-like enzyme/Tfp pilus assembly protein PilF
LNGWLSSLLLSLLLAGHAAAAAPPPARKGPVNVILVTMDTLRADHVGCYGATQVKTPMLDALAHDGVVFEHAYSQVPLTWPSHAAILTGTYPFQNGVQDFTGQPLAPQFHTIAQGLKAHGYATGAVVSAYVLDRGWGLSRGFDFYDDAFAAETFQKKDLGLVDRKAAESVDRAIGWLKKTPQRPLFLWLHLYDPHSPYDPPEPYRTEYSSHLYDGEIAYADHELGRLIGWLKQSRLYDNSLIIFLSDHGESLGEHGEDEHGFFIYNSTIHIPLIVKPPAGSGLKPSRVASPIETVAVAPTIFRMAGVHDLVEKQFQSPPLFAADPAADAAYSETFYPFSSFGWNPLHSLETSRYHYIEAPTPELYDLASDPEEKNNLAPQQAATASVLKDKLQQRLKVNPFAQSQGNGSGLDPDAAEKLRALGYVAYRAPVSAEALAKGLPDPKAKVEEFRAILKATDAFHIGDFDTGKALLHKVREQDPNIYIVPFMLGEGALRESDWQTAASELRRCLELNPNFDQAMTGLAHALVELGNVTEAQQWLQKALDYNPRNYRALYELGSLKARSDKTAARADLEKAVAIQPNFAPLQRDLGMLLVEQKDYAEAGKHLSKAIELGVNEARIHNVLGICYSRTGKMNRAVEAYQQALAIDPNLAEAHLNLGFAYQQLGRAADSRAEYGTACKLRSQFCEYVPK